MSLDEVRQAMLLEAQLGRNGEAGAQLLAYQPNAYDGKGRATIVYGDLDHADNVAVSVPGLKSGMHNIDNVAGDALHLYKQALKADPDQHTAVVAWQGYDAPGFGNVLFQGSAEGGAKLLAADVNAMRATHDGSLGKLTVVAHSYGSTTTGLALQREGLLVDQVVLIGSPGVGGDAKTAADLKLKPAQVFVGSASQDEVTTGTNTLGADPSHEDFGPVVRFKAESVDRDRNGFLADHSLYYDEGNHSESLYNLASIVTGHGDRLAAEGMLAEPRHTAWTIDSAGDAVLIDEDPEATRTPTAGHDHANDPGSTNP